MGSKSIVLKKRLALIILGIICLYFCKEFIIKIIDYSRQYDVTVIGSIGYVDGMHRQPIDLITLLDPHLKVNGIGIRKFVTRFLDEKIIKMFHRGNQLGRVVVFEDTIALNINGEDNIIQDVMDKQLFKIFNRDEQIFIAYSMFESDTIPDIWVERLNEQFDMVVVPDPYFIEIYKNAGVNIPIFFLPLGINLNAELRAPLKTARNPKFVYANFAQGEDRKNQLKLLQAFEKVQSLREDTYLILHSRFTFGTSKTEIFNYIKNHNIPNVQYTTGELSPDLYHKMYNKVDCVVYPSKGEGFAIQPREAMARGIPAIITNNTAQQTICNSGLVECINSDIKRSAYYSIYSNGIVMGNNFDCSVDDIVTAMLKLYDNYDKYLKKSEQARNWAARYTYDKLKPQYLNMVKPIKVILGNKNEITEHYFMTNSEKLYNKYKQFNSKTSFK